VHKIYGWYFVKLMRLVDDFTMTNNFEILFKNNKIKIAYYDELIDFKNDLVIVRINNSKIKIFGKNLRIESMYKEYVLIGGIITKMLLEGFYDE